MAANPQFAQTPEFNLVSFSLSGTSSRTSASSNCLRLITGSTASGYYGTKITQIGVKHTNANSNPAGLVHVYISDSTGTSASALLYDEIQFTATTPSTTAVTQRVINTYTDLQLVPGQAIFVGSSLNASTQSFVVWASGGDF
jgi:hypothetical protein